MQPGSFCCNNCCYFFLVLLPLLLLLLRLHRKTRKEAWTKLPPGPWRLPIIGSLHHLITKPLMHCAMADLARRCDAPVMYLQLGEVPAVVVSSPEAAREVMKTHDAVFATRPMCQTVKATADEGLGLVFKPYGEQWRQLRKICTVELLSARRVRSFRAVREGEASRLVTAIAESPPGGKVNVSARIAAFVNDSALHAILGERFKRRDEFLKTLDEVVKLNPGLSIGDLFPSSRLVCAVSGTVRKVRAVHRKVTELVDSAIEQHRERKAAAADGAVGDEDLLDVLMRIRKEGSLDCPLDMGTIKAVILDLFAGGSETTSTTLQWVMSELVRNPKAMQKAQSEIRHALQGKARVTEDDLINLKFLKLVIKETLRLHAPIPLLIPRECMESCKILGYDVPKGALVLVNAWAIGMDPKYWDEPEAFKPERFDGSTVDFKGTDFEFIPFGAGRRMCPGIAFAHANLELSLSALLYHFDWQLPTGMAPSELDMAEEMGITIHRKRDLYLCPTVRVPACCSIALLICKS